MDIAKTKHWQVKNTTTIAKMLTIDFSDSEDI